MILIGVTGWVLFVLAVAWNVRLRRNAMKSHLSLFCYLVLNLFNDSIRDKQSVRLAGWLAQSKVTGEEVLLQAMHGTQEVADQMLTGDGQESSYYLAAEMLQSAKEAM